MSAKPAAIKASFSDWRTVKTRKVLQLIFEVPLEGQADVLTYLGTPSVLESKWCGIALIQEPTTPAPARIENKSKQSWSEMLPAQQAAIRCNEPGFLKFLEHKKLGVCSDSHAAANAVRLYCDIDSRSKLNTNSGAAAIWKKLDDAYFYWSRGIEQ